MTRPGTTWERAPKTAWERKWPMRWRAPTAQGRRVLRIEPSGAVTVTGRKLPSLLGTWGLMAQARG